MNTELPDNPELFEASMKAVREIAEREAASSNPDTPQEAKVEAPTQPEPTQEAPKVEAPVSAPDESLAAKFKKLLAREASTREVETKFKQEREAWEAQKAQQEQELAEYRAWKAKRVDEARRFEHDPYGYIKSLNPNLDPSRVANRIWGKTLGEAAPAELRQEEVKYEAQKSVDELRAEISEWRDQWKQEQAKAAQEQAYNQYVGAVSAYAQSNLDKYPLVKAYSESNPERVVQGLLKVADSHATATSGKELLTPEQSAAKLEAMLQNLAQRLNPPAPKSEKPAEPQTPSTLRNQHQSIQQPREVADRGEALFQHALEQARKAGAG